MQCRALLQRPGQRTRQRDLEPIQDPGDPEREHDAGVEAAPAQRIETEGDTGFNDAIVVQCRRLRCRQITLPSLQIHRNEPMGNPGYVTLKSLQPRRRPVLSTGVALQSSRVQKGNRSSTSSLAPKQGEKLPWPNIVNPLRAAA